MMREYSEWSFLSEPLLYKCRTRRISVQTNISTSQNTRSSTSGTQPWRIPSCRRLLCGRCPPDRRARYTDGRRCAGWTRPDAPVPGSSAAADSLCDTETPAPQEYWSYRASDSSSSGPAHTHTQYKTHTHTELIIQWHPELLLRSQKPRVWLVLHTSVVWVLSECVCVCLLNSPSPPGTAPCRWAPPVWPVCADGRSGRCGTQCWWGKTERRCPSPECSCHIYESSAPWSPAGKHTRYILQSDITWLHWMGFNSQEYYGLNCTDTWKPELSWA